MLLDNFASTQGIGNESPIEEALILPSNEEALIVPVAGMKFASMDATFEFYKRYAYAVGFLAIKRNTQKGPNGKIKYVVFTCGRTSNRRSVAANILRPRPTIKTGCMARVSACVDISGDWRINKVFLHHNHNCSPSKSKLFRCNREISVDVRKRLEINDTAGIPLHKSFNSTIVETCGYEYLTYTEKDCRNYIDKARRLRLGEGDDAALMAYFVKMQNASPEFFYSIDVDDEGRLTNVFWADNQSRQAYAEFGDVVTFDATYLVNKYECPSPCLLVLITMDSRRCLDAGWYPPRTPRATFGFSGRGV